MHGACRLSHPILAGAAMLLGCAIAAAQVPNPNRHVHPSIAAPAAGAMLRGTSPLFQYDDGVWNHGEGFGATQPDADSGGWHGEDDGTAVTSADVHTPADAWEPFVWHSLHLASSATPGPPGASNMERLYGYLRPAGLSLPTEHPLYGQIPGGYVDQGAFEIFRRDSLPSPTQKIVVFVQSWPTVPFPLDRGSQPYKWSIYRGFFSPDGLTRREPINSGRTPQEFLANNDIYTVERPDPSPVLMLPASVYPLCAYHVLSMPGRQTSLNQQRDMQLIKAIKCMLQENSARNPVGQAMTEADIEARVVVFMGGGSNGGFTASWSVQKWPRLVHGAFASSISPSIQRLFGEQDLGYAVTALSGAPGQGGATTEWDFMNWCQNAWNQGLEIHDLSHLRNALRLQPPLRAYRPVCFLVGDEDLTSTGTDWISVIEGTNTWLAQGVKPFAAGPWSVTPSFGWSTSETMRHDIGLFQDPYGVLSPPSTTLITIDVAQGTVIDAVNVRAAELAANPANPPPQQPLTHEPRASDLRGLDDPHEWFMGRDLPAAPTPGPELVLDDDFSPNPQVSAGHSQPGAAGARLGSREAMLIRDQSVFVGSGEGLVSRFRVDTTHLKRPLVREAQSEQLGHAAYAMAAVDESGGWSLVVGTRRHLFKLDPVTLQVTAQSPILPWEVAQPHAMKVADVLPSTGPEVIFASVHGGLCFYSASTLSPLYEWPEPGIVDFLVNGQLITILSHRGVLAAVNFATIPPLLSAASQPFPRRLVQYVDPQNYDSWLDSPCQGNPIDLEIMEANLGPYGVAPGLISLWSSDEDRLAVRCHVPGSLLRVPTLVGGLTDLRQYIPDDDVGLGDFDLATCRESGTNPLGDHVLVLAHDNLMLFDQNGIAQGRKTLFLSEQGFFPFGLQANAIAVGELVDNSTSQDYQQEVVVATQSGALLWLHVDDVHAPGTVLPASANGGVWAGGYWLDVARNVGSVADTHVQPRTNMSLSSTWAIGRKPGENRVRVIDQRGGYWSVAYDGTVRMEERDRAVAGARGMDFIGSGSPWSDAITESFFGDHVRIAGGTASEPAYVVETQPWVPLVGYIVPFENTPRYLHDNWFRLPTDSSSVIDGFIVHAKGGSVASTVQGGLTRREAWYWSSSDDVDWANFMEAVRIDTLSSTPNLHDVSGVWASTEWPATESVPGLVGDKTDHLALRNFTEIVAAGEQQAVKAVTLLSGETRVVLGCPGGRVRILHPGAMRVLGSEPTVHVKGTLIAKSDDFGFGGSALAVRHEVAGSEMLRIWSGSLYAHTPKPAGYDSASGALLDGEVAAGAIRMATWFPGSPGTITTQQEIRLTPGGGFRGAYGVVGLKVVDLLSDPSSPVPLDELIVGTMSGDLLIYTIDTSGFLVQPPRWRTHVPGGIGFYNAILAEDLNDDGRKELYVAGSLGLWRFLRADEVTQ